MNQKMENRGRSIKKRAGEIEFQKPMAARNQADLE
jgi:hypothetical protein